MTNISRVRNFICSEFAPDLNPDAIPAELDLIESGIIDSLGILKIVAFLEEEFGMTILMDETEADLYRSLQSIASFIEAKRGADLAAA